MSKKKKSSGSKSNFNPKEFLILHVEKLVFGLIAAIACMVMYFGFNTTSFPSEKTPEKLQAQATQVSSKIKENHNDVIMKEEGRRVEPIYSKSALNTRVIKDPIAHASNPMGASKTNSSSKRGDPGLLAPEHLEASYYYGAVARLSSQPDPLDKLDDAKKPEVREKPDNNNNDKGFPGKGKGGSSSAGSSSSGGSAPSGGGMEGMAGSGGMGMMGSGGDGDSPVTGQRRLSPMYDLGYKLGMRTFPEASTAFGGGEGPNAAKPDAAPKKPVALALGLVCVTALAPHEDMEDNYKKQFYEVVGYTPGRDTPNYVGFEAQRAEVSAANPDKEIAESDWVALPKASPATFKEQLKVLAGTASEVHLPDMVEPNISMPIPPILLTDYRKYASNSVLAELEEKENGALGSPSASGFSGGMGMGKGMSSGSSSGGLDGDGGDAGMVGSAPGAGSMGMPGGSSMGMPGGMAKGRGGSSSSGGGSSYQDNSAAANVVMELPKQLPSTKYKLVRFYDFNPPVGKIFKYRVRLLMYDSNHPEWASFKPAASTLNNEALKRVQTLEIEESKEVPKAGAASGPVKRICQRETSWSAPTKPILIVKPASVFIAKGEGKEEKLESVFVDFEKERAIDVPRKELIEAGLVFGTPLRAKGKEAPIDIIHPIKKIIKALKDFRSTNLVTIVNLKQSQLLQMGSLSKDPIKTGAEMVSFDPLTGQLVISREFDNFTSFHLHTQPDGVPVGPLGGGLALGGSAGAFGGDGGMSSGGEGSSGGLSGPGAPPGGGSGGGKKGMSSSGAGK